MSGRCGSETPLTILILGLKNAANPDPRHRTYQLVGRVVPILCAHRRIVECYRFQLGGHFTRVSVMSQPTRSTTAEGSEAIVRRSRKVFTIVLGFQKDFVPELLLVRCSTAGADERRARTRLFLGY
jgi:hypothetical protein